MDAVAVALPALLRPAGQAEDADDAQPQQDRLPELARLHPLVAAHGAERRHREHGHGHAVGRVVAALAAGRRLLRPGRERLLEGFLGVPLRPARSQRAHAQLGHDAFALPRGRERPEEGDEGIGAGIEEVVVAVGAEGDVVGTLRAQRQRPRLLPLAQAQGVVHMRHIVDHGLRVVGGELVAHGLLVEAAGHEGDAVGVARQLEGEGFGDGDRTEQVLDAEEGALAAARGRHLEEDGWLRFGPAGEQAEGVELHGVVPFLSVFLRLPGAAGSSAGRSGKLAHRAGHGRSSVENGDAPGNVL